MGKLRFIILNIVLTITVDYACSAITYRDLAVENRAVWIASIDGLVKFNRLTGSFEKFESETFNNLSAVAVSPDGNISVAGAKNEGVAIFDGESFKPITTEKDELFNVSALTYANGLWIGKTHMILHNDGDTWTTWDSQNPYLSSYQFNNFAYDKKTGKMWFGVSSSGSISKLGYINSTGSMVFINDFHVDDIWPSVTGIYLTPAGKLYIASTHGMFTCNNNTVSTLEHPFKELSTSWTSVTGNGEKIWFSSGKVLVQYDEEQYNSYTFDLSDNPNDFIVKLYADGDKVWVMMAYGGLFEFKNEKFSTPTTGVGTNRIGHISDDKPTDNYIYNLNGQRIANPDKGQLCIKDGKKIIIR